jgi:hypothetical protein
MSNDTWEGVVWWNGYPRVLRYTKKFLDAAH